ncbi:RERE [Cordylochernes scorpioides]|uniref:RERE n=1 Tax=Cordylochernes scorpioides TaxID=51811 RepID=A0ABY6KJ61_9ARAC|nr:RERE [Cordylochernes scorpioides]
MVLGYLLNEGIVLGYLLNEGIVLGYLLNEGAVLGYLLNEGTVLGYLLNERIVLGYLLNEGTVLGYLLNEGTVLGYLLNERIVLGYLLNEGTVLGYLLNERIVLGYLLNEGTVLGCLLNEGIVLGYLLNEGTVLGYLLNERIVLGYLLNEGTVLGYLLNEGIVLLHDSNYDTGKALQALVKNPIPPGIEKKWTEEEQAEWQELLQDQEGTAAQQGDSELRGVLFPQRVAAAMVCRVTWWSSTTSGRKPPPPSPPGHTAGTADRTSSGKYGPALGLTVLATTTSSCNNKCCVSTETESAAATPADLSSASEEEDSEDSDSRDLSGYACHHCYTTTSKDWHHAGKDHALLCTECRVFFKKYGELRPLPEPREQPPSFLFKPVKEEDNSKHIMRTRRNKDMAQTISNFHLHNHELLFLLIYKGKYQSITQPMCAQKPSRDSPAKSTATTNNKKRQRDTEVKVEPTEAVPTDESETKTPSKKKPCLEGGVTTRPASPSESSSTTTESSGSNEEAGHDGDNEAENLSSPSSLTAASPTLPPSLQPEQPPLSLVVAAPSPTAQETAARYLGIRQLHSRPLGYNNI